MNKFFSIIAIILLFTFGCTQTEKQQPVNKNAVKSIEMEFSGSGLSTNTAISSIDLSDVISGGPGKDGIPAIKQPKFTSVADASNTIHPETLGIVVGIKEKRFYPYNILVWHEIVNDEIDGKPIAVTFCPLCGSAIVFDRQIGNATIEFGVSGFLYQSNLLMYDSKTESLWSQVRGEAVVGDYTGTKLQLISSQIMNFSDFKTKYPNGTVLSINTGFSRDYSFYPYGDYNDNSQIYFPIKDFEAELPLKEIVYVLRVDDSAVVFPLQKIQNNNATIMVGGNLVSIIYENSELNSFIDGKPAIGYYAMYFSVVAQNDNVIVWKVN